MTQKTTILLKAASDSSVPQNKACAVTTWNSSAHDKRSLLQIPIKGTFPLWPLLQTCIFQTILN